LLRNRGKENIYQSGGGIVFFSGGVVEVEVGELLEVDVSVPVLVNHHLHLPSISSPSPIFHLLCHKLTVTAIGYPGSGMKDC
jgi:hypothetical protein